jgi:NAD(P)-dependent dehydrogenase (short-subunit alcohol dehydrogenase family)
MAEQDLAGKTAVVTGASAGIGLEVAQRLAERGARLLLVSRDRARTQAAADTLAKGSGAVHVVLTADLANIADTRRVAGEIAAQAPVIDLLINNAGAVFAKRQVTAEGLEKTFALNHMGYFVLTLGLLDQVKAAPKGRIVVTSSRMHSMGDLDFDDLQMARRYDSYLAYGRSKLCNILFSRALAKRLEGTEVKVNAVHPGFVATHFGDDNRGLLGAAFSLAKVFALRPEQGALTTLHAATSEEGGRLTGAYFEKSRPTEPSAAARNDASAERLWSVSTELLGST